MRNTNSPMIKQLSLLTCAVCFCAVSVSASDKTFLLLNASRDINEFRAFAKMASHLKPYGEVQIDIGVLADKSWYEMPKGGSAWHEYAAYASCMAKFFPHPKIAPFIPADWVAKNRQLLLAKAAVLRDFGLTASFSSDDTHFLPEAFFAQYPQLRGPRVDHPRRSRREEFSWCVDQKETLDMIEWMAAELKRQVPEIKTILSHNNDSGAGLCWAAALYSGPNGPRHCEGRSAGIRVKELTEAIHRGAEKGGGKVTIRMDGNFWEHEDEMIAPLLPPDTYLSQRDRTTVSVESLLSEAYPIQGLLNPIAIISAVEKSADPRVKTIVINTSSWYKRSDESPETVARIVETVKDCLTEPTRGLLSRLNKLHKLALQWGGERYGDAVFEALYGIDEAFRLKTAVAQSYSNLYCGVSARHITRPLLVKPDLLTADEESYFLPYVFSIFDSEARNDYIDIHGERMRGPASWTDPGVRRALDRALSAARTLDATPGAPEERWLKQLALSLKMWVSEVRSIHNLYFAQLIRDRNKAVLAGQPRIPSKEPTWTGDGDYLEWNEIQRDEFDNTNELIGILENGGLELFARARDARHEDTFLMGPDIIGALRQKSQLMRRQWLDVQYYLRSPLK